MGGHDDKPWLTEPDDHLFESHGYVCRARRPEHLGHWNGYIYIPMTHPYFGVHYDDAELTVHGGLTYSEREGEAWCFGFDCGHYHDYVPSRHALLEGGGSGFMTIQDNAEYRTLDYVINELDYLAKQLKEKKK